MTYSKSTLLLLALALASCSLVYGIRSWEQLKETRLRLNEIRETTAQANKISTSQRFDEPASPSTSEKNPASLEAIARRDRFSELNSLFKSAKLQLKSGDFEEALATFRQCLIAGDNDQRFSQQRFLEIYQSLEAIPSLDAGTLKVLEQHRNRYKQRWQNNPQSSSAFLNWMVLNQTLDKTSETVAIFDKVSGEPQPLTFYPDLLFEAMYRSGRYKDALDAKGYYGLRSDLENHIIETTNRESASPASASYTIRTTSNGIEALATTGELERAMELADRLIEFYPLGEVAEQVAESFGNAGETNLEQLYRKQKAHLVIGGEK